MVIESADDEPVEKVGPVGLAQLLTLFESLASSSSNGPAPRTPTQPRTVGRPQTAGTVAFAS